MSDIGTRLARIEAKLDEIAPAAIDRAERMRELRRARLERLARGEPEPPRRMVPLADDGALDSERLKLRRFVNDAGVRRYLCGEAGYEAFAELAAQKPAEYQAAFREQGAARRKRQAPNGPNDAKVSA